MTKDHVIAYEGRLPWRIKSEKEHYKAIISGKTIIMGRNTYKVTHKDSVSSHNIVITHQNLSGTGFDVCSSLEDAIRKAKTYSDEIYIVGGQSIFEQAIHIADTMQLSYVKGDFKGDKFFPKFSDKDWQEVSREEFEEFVYVVYKRKTQKSTN